MDELKIGIIGGTGLGEILRAGGEALPHEVGTPFGMPSGVIFESSWPGARVFFLARHGEGHLIPPARVPYRANIFALKQLGCTTVIASGAVGSLREEFKPGDLAVADQVIDKTTARAGSFFENAAVHVEFAEPFCPVLRQILLDAGGGDGFTVHNRGCYVAMEGPAFSTRAESLMHRLWGGDLIGMTAMPEAKLAREAEMSYALLALVTDYDSWKAKPVEKDKPAEPIDAAALLKEIQANLATTAERAGGLIRRAVEVAGGRREALMAAPAREALKLGIWSDRSRISVEEIERLRPLWGKYF
jgi:5'-methylthioadenosine phosphorylase